MKLLRLSVILLAVILCFTSCSAVSYKPDAKEFSKDGLSITLDMSFSEVEHEAYTAAYQSDKILVFTLKDKFELFGKSNYRDDMTLTEYAQLTISSNGYTTEPFTEDGLVGFAYNYTENGQDYTFIGYVFKGTDAFWHLQFGAKAEEFEALKKDILKFAKQVKIS